jgi:hypothetical protein
MTEDEARGTNIRYLHDHEVSLARNRSFIRLANTALVGTKVSSYSIDWSYQ